MEHRTGRCEKCHIPFVDFDTGELDDEDGESILIKQCPKCEGMNGELVSRQAIVKPPEPLTCMKFSCVWRYFIACFRYTLLLKYHQNRSAYAEKWSKSGSKERYREIPEKYRTGMPMPIRFKDLILWNIWVRGLLWLG